ncbi:selenoprotein N [Moschus berezovskii]|uniref:selenoprotein N n=1 Tax=Moschus berezovskii TaxID=68408 RepID=UPI002444B8FA|nr:selenoprotein N [Moschus berezovskii]
MGRTRPGERGPAGPGPAAPPAPPPRRARALALLGALLAAAAAAAAARAFARYSEAQAAARQDSALKTLGTEGLFLFSSLDTDRDMYISPEEFKPIAEKLTGSTPTADYEEEELPPDPSEETLTIEARFQPLLPESMTKSKDGFLGVSWGRRGRGLPETGPETGGPSARALAS